LTLPLGLNERILSATLGNVVPAEVRAPFTSRFASRLRIWLDPIMSPQLATVATMLLAAVFVLTSTVSADGSISGMYSASLKLAQQSYTKGNGVSGAGISEGVKKFFVGGTEESTPPANPQGQPVPDNKVKGSVQKNDGGAAQKPENSPKGKKH